MSAKKKIKVRTALSQRALLVQVTIGQWTAKKISEEATETVIKAHKTERSAGNYTKKLLPGAMELEVVSALASQIRKYYYEQTLPWMSEGARIISGKNHMKFASEFRKMKNEFDSAVKDFVKAYPKLQSSAKVKLGALYDADDYPHKDVIEDKFKCEVAYLPVPDSDDFRIKISETEKKEFIRKIKEVEAKAMKECWERLHKVTLEAAKRLKDPKAIFRDSLVGNIKDLCELMPSLNISEDPKLEKSRKEIEAMVSGLDVKALRTNAKDRSSAAKKLNEISSKMSAFVGDGK